MTNSILKTQSNLSIQRGEQVSTLNVLVGLVSRSLKNMEKRHIQLFQISEDHFDVYIRMQAEEFLVNQSKMITIAEELKTRIAQNLKLSKYETISDELIQQFLDEIDIMNFMDFKITKKYFSFIHTNHESRVIQMIPVAA